MYTIMCGLFERLEPQEQGGAETAQSGEFLKERRLALLRRLVRGEKERGGSVLRHKVRLRAQSRGSGCAGRERHLTVAYLGTFRLSVEVVSAAAQTHGRGRPEEERATAEDRRREEIGGYRRQERWNRQSRSLPGPSSQTATLSQPRSASTLTRPAGS